MKTPETNLNYEIKTIETAIKALIWFIAIILLTLTIIICLNIHKDYETLYQNEKYTKIIKIHEKEKNPKTENLIYIANSYYKTNKKNKALKIYQKIFSNQPIDLIAIDPYKSEGYLNYIEIAKAQKNLPPIRQFVNTNLSDYNYKVDLIIGQNLAKKYLNTIEEENKIYESSKILVNYSMDRKKDIRQGGYLIENNQLYINKDTLKRDFIENIDLKDIDSIELKDKKYYSLNSILEGPLKNKYKAFIEMTPGNLNLTVLQLQPESQNQDSIKVTVNENGKFIIENPIIKQDQILYPINKIYYYGYGKNYLTKEDSNLYKDTKVYSSVDGNLRIFKKQDNIWYNHHAEKIDLDTIALNVIPKVTPEFTKDDIYMDEELLEYYLKDYKLKIDYNPETKEAIFQFGKNTDEIPELRQYISPEEFIRLNKEIFSENPKNVIFWTDYTRRRAYEEEKPKYKGIDQYKLTDKKLYTMLKKYYDIDKETFDKFTAIPVE